MWCGLVRIYLSLTTLLSVNPKRKSSLSANVGHLSLLQAIAYSQDRSADRVSAAERKKHNGKICMLGIALSVTSGIDPAAMKTHSALSPLCRPTRSLTFPSQ